LVDAGLRLCVVWKPGAIRVITFDGDGTLWDVHAAARVALAGTVGALRRDFGARCEGVGVAELEKIREEVAAASAGMSMEAVRRGSFAEALRRHGVTVSAGYLDELVGEFLAARHAHTRCYLDVLPTLRRLAGRYPLGLLTNGNTPPTVTGLDTLLRYVHLSHDRQMWKPDPRVWVEAAAALGAPTAALLHIGDSRSEDYDAALAAGCSALLLRRSGGTDASGCEVIADLTVLVDLLDAEPAPTGGG
jgi:HAD superfamily hydrolase (TIGR01549 family)